MVFQNLIKNILIVLIGILFWPFLADSLEVIQVNQLGDLLLVISILLVTVCFANFAFTYEKSKIKTGGGWLLHSTTFVFMLLTLLLLETMTLAIGVVYPSFYNIIFGFSIFLYFGIVLYDFWDLYRLQ